MNTVISIKFTNDNDIEWIAELRDGVPVLKIELHRNQSLDKVSIMLEPYTYLRLCFTRNTQQLMEYSYCHTDECINRMYKLRNRMPHFPIITMEDKVTLKLTYDADLTYIEMNEDGFLSKESTTLITLKVVQLAKDFMSKSKEDFYSQVYKWLRTNGHLQHENN